MRQNDRPSLHSILQYVFDNQRTLSECAVGGAFDTSAVRLCKLKSRLGFTACLRKGFRAIVINVAV